MFATTRTLPQSRAEQLANQAAAAAERAIDNPAFDRQSLFEFLREIETFTRLLQSITAGTAALRIAMRIHRASARLANSTTDQAQRRRALRQIEQFIDMAAGAVETAVVHCVDEQAGSAAAIAVVMPELKSLNVEMQAHAAGLQEILPRLRTEG